MDIHYSYKRDSEESHDDFFKSVSQIYSQHVFTEYTYYVNIYRVVLSIYLQNAHMSVIRFDLFSQDMIFTLSTFERGNLYAHLGLK